MNLVSGGSGYFGELLVKKLLERGEKCAILDINPPSKELLDKVVFFQTDIRDLKAVMNACKNIKAVYHNVAQVPLAKDKDLFTSVNYQGTQNIVDAAIKSGVKKFVYTSSSAVFGIPKENPVTELTDPSPGEAYGKAKYNGEKICLENKNKGMDISIIRPRTILGHGRLGIFQILFEWIYQGKNVPVFDHGNNLYQFVHSDDLAEACILSAEIGTGGIYNIGAKNFGTMRNLLEDLIKHAGTSSKIKSLSSKVIVPGMNLASKIGASPLGAYHAMMYGKSMYFDVSKAEKELNWSSKFSNKEMIIESYDWYVKNRNEILNSDAKTSHHKSAVKQGILSIISKLL